MLIKSRFPRSFLWLCLLGFCVFYYKYVPLAKAFQLALFPLLLGVLILTAFHVRYGLALFIFAFPLVNNLPYFFDIFEDTPHAPTALVLFLAFFLGWLIHRLRHLEKSELDVSVFRPLMLFSCLILVSAFLTFLRYTNFFPFLSNQILEIIVNVNRVKAGGALMSVVFSTLNYLTGILFFFILMDTIKSRAQIQKLLMVLSLSVFLSLLFSFFQKYGSLRTGNTPYWVLLHQMNATFKDPNSFAGFLAAFFPLLLGLHFSFRRRGKLLSWLLMALVFFVFPWLGARSAFLAILVSLAVFLILALISAPKILNKKYIPFILVSGLLFLGVFSFFILSKESRLWQRLGWSFSVFSQKISWTEFLSHRRYFWNSALYMIKDYPLTGVGIGAYIIELPNYLFLHRLHFASTDSALNYAFQVGSEFGLVGLIVVFWLIMEIVRTIKRAWWTTKDDLKNRMLLIGAVSGLSAFFVNFFFHTYIGSFEMKYFLWLIIATICFLSRPEIKGDSDHPANRRFSRAAICLTLVFGIILLWNSTHSLSLSRRAGKLGWNQYFGLYEIERNQQGLYFQWAKKTSGITLENLGPTLVIPMTASHPDLQKNPVQVKIFLANQNFRIKKLLQEVWMQKPGWIQCEFPVAQFQERTIQLVFKTDRAWQPLKDLKIHDPRRLAIGLGEFWFRYPADVPAEKIHAVHKISAEAWEGTQKANLFSPGSSRIRFRSESRNVAIRLWAKGQKAFDIGPYLVIKLDDTTIGKTMLDQDGWLSLILQAEINEGDHILSVEFTNDIHDPKKGQDRNVFLGDVEILSLKNP